MSDLGQFIATLRLAAEVYRELGDGRDEPWRGLDFADAARRVAAAADHIQALAPRSIMADAAPIAETLGDWRAGMNEAAIVLELEGEILRLGDAIYRSAAPDDVKRELEPLLGFSEAAVALAEGKSLSEVHQFALEDATTPLTEELAEPSEGSTSETEQVEGYPVWYATNRAPVDPKDPSRGFANSRDAAVHHGRCVVHVPSSHRIGSLGSNVLVRVLGRKDDRLKIRRIERLSVSDFQRELDSHIARAESRDRHAVVFIHGYNVSFEGAALRAAQLGDDLGIGGGMAFFSWPSKARRRSYFADGDSIAASAGEITDFLVSVATLPSVEHVHVIAHSMGNRGALAAVNRIASAAEDMSGRKFSQFILAAADVDADVFRKEAGAYLHLGDRTTLYVSDRDRALAVSSIISEYPRVGFHPPLSLVDGFDTIDVGAVDLDRLGHGYVGDNRGVLADIHELIFDAKPAGERFGLEERTDGQGSSYWTFKP